MKSFRHSVAHQARFETLPLFEYSKVINTSLDLTFILNTVLLTVMGKMMVSKGMVLLQREKGWFEIVAAKGLEPQLLGMVIPIGKSPRSIFLADGKASSQYRWMTFFKSQEQKILIPIIARAKCVGLLSLGTPLAGKKYSNIDKKLITSLVDLSGSAIEKAMMIDELQQVNRHLDRKYQELNTLFDLSKEFNVGLDVDRVIRLLTFSLLGQVGVNRYVVCLIENEKLSTVSSQVLGHFELDSEVRQLFFLKNPTRTTDLIRKKIFKDAAIKLQQLEIALAIPMQVQNQTRGLILLGKKLRGGDYTKSDFEFLYSLGNLAIISIENARLFREAIEKQRLEDELAIAREIQQGLLPKTLPTIPGFDIAAISIPSRQVGGDYYDVIVRSEKEFVVAIGDVSGKGTPAALLMASVQAALRALVPMGLSLPEATARINDLTVMNMSQNKFITFFWGVFNPQKRELRYVNAGHCAPFIIRSDASVERLERGGIILGIMKTLTPYEEDAVVLRSEDLLVLFTDGVSEAMNAEGLEFSEEKLEEILRHNRNSSAQSIIDAVRQELLIHTKGTPQSDDITMVVLKAL